MGCAVKATALITRAHSLIIEDIVPVINVGGRSGGWRHYFWSPVMAIRLLVTLLQQRALAVRCQSHYFGSQFMQFGHWTSGTNGLATNFGGLFVRGFFLKALVCKIFFFFLTKVIAGL